MGREEQSSVTEDAGVVDAKTQPECGLSGCCEAPALERAGFVEKLRKPSHGVFRNVNRDHLHDRKRR
jgi:hypothetical protein